MPHLTQPQPLESLPAEAGAAAESLRARLAAAFGASLHALYLYGAITFAESEGTGDLDYHAILTAAPDQEQRAAYAAACTSMADQAGGSDLDGWVISLTSARGSAAPQHLIQSGMRDQSWALHRAHWLAGRCVVLQGPEPARLVLQPSWDELRAGLTAELDFAARGPDDAFAILNFCRILRSLADHDVVQSKFGSAWWALEQLPVAYADAIQAAMNTYRGTGTQADAQVMVTARAAITALASSALRQ